MNRKKNKTLLILSLGAVLLIFSLSYSIWSKSEQTAINNYEMYMSRQFEIVNYLQNSLDVKNNRSDFINKLILAKGEFTYIDKIMNHVAMPDSLKIFHERGKTLIDKTMDNASSGKSLNSNISEIEEYTSKLRQMVRELTSIIAKDKKSATNIYKDLDNLGRKLQLSK
jgi:hypothetical protein